MCTNVRIFRCLLQVSLFRFRTWWYPAERYLARLCSLQILNYVRKLELDGASNETGMIFSSGTFYSLSLSLETFTAEMRPRCIAAECMYERWRKRGGQEISLPSLFPILLPRNVIRRGTMQPSRNIFRFVALRTSIFINFMLRRCSLPRADARKRRAEVLDIKSHEGKGRGGEISFPDALSLKAAYFASQSFM